MDHQNWRALVAPEDTIVLGGIFRGASTLRKRKAIFAADRLAAGKKDHFEGQPRSVETASKMPPFSRMKTDLLPLIFSNNCFLKDRVVRHTRLVIFEEDSADPHNEKIFKRELGRIEASLKLGVAADPRRFSVSCIIRRFMGPTAAVGSSNCCISTV